jgi:hypothetical protein
MKPISIKALVTTTLCSLISTAAIAEVKQVSAGRNSMVLSFSLYDSTTCAFGPKPRVTFTQPQHGTLSAKWVSGRDTKKGMCYGKTMKGFIIFYQPKAGYHGPDSGRVNFFYSTYVNGTPDKSDNQKIDVNVK